MMMSDATAEAGTAEEEAPAPTGELTELARLEIRIGKIVEVTAEVSFLSLLLSAVERVMLARTAVVMIFRTSDAAVERWQQLIWVTYALCGRGLLICRLFMVRK